VRASWPGQRTFTAMADGTASTKQGSPPQYRHQAKSANGHGNGELQAATTRLEHSMKKGSRTPRRMTVDSLQRMVNKQLVDDLFRDLSSGHESSGQTPRSSSYTPGFDSVVCSRPNSQPRPTNENHVFESAAKPRACKGSWPFKLPQLRGTRKEPPSTSNMP